MRPYTLPVPTLHEKARAFAERHRGPAMIVLPNAWDPGSAVVFADAGFPCIAIRRAATELRDHGTAGCTRDAMSNAEANALMRAARRDG